LHLSISANSIDEKKEPHDNHGDSTGLIETASGLMADIGHQGTEEKQCRKSPDTEREKKGSSLEEVARCSGPHKDRIGEAARHETKDETEGIIFPDGFTLQNKFNYLCSETVTSLLKKGPFQNTSYAKPRCYHEEAGQYRCEVLNSGEPACSTHKCPCKTHQGTDK